MAGGMHSAALDQIGASSVAEEDDNLDELISQSEKGEFLEIIALSEERSQQAAQILEERRIQSNPVKAAMRNIQCDSTGEVNQAAEAKKPSPASQIRAQIVNKMPIFSWLPNLNLRLIRSDIIAGLTVGVMCIPQSMSYANIAGLQYVYGMYSACMPTLIYGLFGQSRQLAVGPVAMVSLLVEAGLRGQLTEDMAKSDACKAWFSNAAGKEQYQVCPDEYAELAMLVSMVVGIMQVVGSILRLGFLVSFLGHPVTSGFTSGAAIIIGLSQVKYWFGFKIAKSQFVYETIYEIGKNIHKTKFMPLILGLLWFAYLFGNKKLAAKYPKLRHMGPMGPLISCVVGILLVWLYKPLREDYGVGYVGEIPDGLFPVSIGKLDFSKIGLVLPTALSSCLIGYMESVAIGKNLAAKHGYEIDAGQEMMALGISNVVGGCFSCYPVTGSFSRSAVMNATGGKTQLGGIVSAIIMFCTLLFLTPLFKYLPTFALASIVISSIIPLVAFSEAKRLYHVKRKDFVLWMVAFIGTMLLGVLLGILIAIVLSLALVIYESVRPQITVLWRVPGTTIYRNVKQESNGAFIPNVFICRIGSSLYFANASFVKDMLLAYTEDLHDVNRTEYVVLEMTPVISVDSTAVHVIQDIVSDFRKRHIQVAFAMVGNRVEKTLTKAKLKSYIGHQWFFPTVDQAVHYCLRHQQAKTSKKLSLISQSSHSLEVGTSVVHVGNEVGFSNEMSHCHTAVFVSLVEDMPVCDISAVFKKYKIAVARAEIEALENGAKHTYFVRDAKTHRKLTAAEMDAIRQDLEGLISTGSLDGVTDIRENDQNGTATVNGNGSNGAANGDSGTSKSTSGNHIKNVQEI